MILFTIIAISFLLVSLIGEDGLISEIRRSIKSYNPVRNVLRDIAGTLGNNILFNMFNWICVFVISMMLGGVLYNTCPQETSHWEFNINALQDNMGIEGKFRYGGRGYINDTLSYYYSRTMPRGEIIEHIPANKTYVRYSDTEKPHVEVHQTQPDIPEWVYKVFFIKWMTGKTTDYYVIVAPEGTITTTGQYEIDMK